MPQLVEPHLVERLGTHRSIEPAGVLPQQARVLDAQSPLRGDEFAVDVDFLNVDSASWHQLKLEADGDAAAMADRIRGIVAERGKMQNPTTGSGGMLVGRVSEVGAHRVEPAVGQRIASLVSLTLTPLVLDEITELDPSSEKVQIKGRAIFFGSSIYATVPSDLPGEVVLGVLDVCGAPAWMARLARPGMRIAVIGAGGKSGMLTCAQAVRSVGPEGRVLGLCWPEETTINAKEAGVRAPTAANHPDRPVSRPVRDQAVVPAGRTTAAAADCSRCRSPAGRAGCLQAVRQTRVEPAVSRRRVRPSVRRATPGSACSA